MIRSKNLNALHTIETGGRPSLSESLVSGPNLLAPLGKDISSSLDDAAHKRVREMLRLTFSMTFSDGKWRWDERALSFGAQNQPLIGDSKTSQHD